jgi:hypothetical protein
MVKIKDVGDNTDGNTNDANITANIARPGPDYSDGMIEVVATDELGLWNSQTFAVRRNRKPIAREGNANPSGDQRPDAFNVGAINEVENDRSDLEPAAGYFVNYGLSNQADNKFKVGIGASALYQDDDTLTYDSDRYVLQDADVATVSISGGTATVMGIGGTTMLTLQAMDTGMLTSPAVTFTVNADPTPTPSKKALQPITASLSQDVVGAGGPTYRLLAVSSYFAHNEVDNDVDGAERLTYTASSSDDDIATPRDYVDAQQSADPDTIPFTLKAIGTVTITLVATESTDTVAPLQSVTREVTLNVVE